MGDWKDDLKKNYGTSNDKKEYNSKPVNAGITAAGYLAKGYFDEKGYLRGELLTDTASDKAKGFGASMNNSQLRRFYQHVKTAENAFSYHKSEERYINDIKKLDAFVAEAKGKGKVPQEFDNFIHQNIEMIKTVKDIKEGFLPHFQAVVAYFTYWYPRSL